MLLHGLASWRREERMHSLLREPMQLLVQHMWCASAGQVGQLRGTPLLLVSGKPTSWLPMPDTCSQGHAHLRCHADSQAMMPDLRNGSAGAQMPAAVKPGKRSQSFPSEQV